MKALLLASLMTLATLNMVQAATPAQSELKLKSCITSVYSKASQSNSASKDVLKEVSFGVKDCRKTIAAMKKAESNAKKQANRAKRIQKLKDQLAKLTSI